MPDGPRNLGSAHWPDLARHPLTDGPPTDGPPTDRQATDSQPIHGTPIVRQPATQPTEGRGVGARRPDGQPIVAIPLGSCEQHGPHLPLDTDTRIAVELAGRLANVREGVLVAPALAYGASWEHAGFPGLLSLDHDVLAALLVQLAHSAEWAAGLVFVNGHGGNHDGVRRAVERLTTEGRGVLAWSPSLPIAGVDHPGNARHDLHAGWAETSVMLALDPSLVDLGSLGDGESGAVGVDRTVLRSRGVAAVSANGVLGDPVSATADAGRAMLDAWTRDLTAAYDRWRSAAASIPR